MATREDRIHPYFVADLTAALESLPTPAALAGIPTLSPAPAAAKAEWIVAVLRDLGWKIEPSRQRRMQLDPPQPPPDPLPPGRTPFA